MKILYCTYHEVDTGLDLLYDGLCRVVGHENVFDYPTKKTLHGVMGRRWTWFPLFFDYPQIADDSTKLEMLKNGEFDLILFSNRIYLHILDSIESNIKDKYIELFSILMGKKLPVYILDMNDGLAVQDRLIDILNTQLYFKRDYLKGTQYNPKIKPLGFCYSQKYSPDVDVDKTNTLFWIGRAYCGRTKYLNAAKFVSPESEIIATGKGEIICNQEQYSQRMLKHKIGLNLFGYGYGDMRYFEIPAHGLLLFSQRLLVYVENDYTDMENAVFFDSVADMMDKLKYCLAHEDFIDKARIAGRQHMLKYHTSEVRAQQLLDKIKSNDI